MKRYNFGNVLNMRDLGGYPSENGLYTKYGRFLRSDVPVIVSEGEAQSLRDMNVTTIIDLRTLAETRRSQCFFCNKPGFNYYNYSLLADSVTALPPAEEDISGAYFQMAERTEAMLNIMRIFAKAESSVLFHCTAGKDRTGVISALLLSLVGVHKYDILADYQVTCTYLRDVFNKIRTDYPDFPFYWGLSKSEYMEGFLDLFFDKYESAYNYLLHIGLTENEIAKIKNKLLY